MRVKGWPQSNQWRRRLWLRLVPHAIILLYHRIAHSDSDPQLLCVSPRYFQEHLEVINRHYRPLHLRDLAQKLRGGQRPQRSVIITFDDGYAGNLYDAKPLLERYGVPATFFITSGYIGKNREFWWDELERLLLQSSQLPRELRIRVNSKLYAWDLGNSASWTDDIHQSCLGWNITCPEVPTSRHEAYRILHSLLKPLDEGNQSQVLKCLAKAAGFPKQGGRAHRVLTEEEVRQLSEGGLVEIGAHTVTHPQLSALSTKNQCWEIQESRRSLEKLINRPIMSFSYPFGSHGDFDRPTVNLVRKTGFQQACATIPGVVTSKSDFFKLPRFTVRNWDGDEFGGRLQTIFST